MLDDFLVELESSDAVRRVRKGQMRGVNEREVRLARVG